jgi:hypothetical protein
MRAVWRCRVGPGKIEPTAFVCERILARVGPPPPWGGCAEALAQSAYGKVQMRADVSGHFKLIQYDQCFFQERQSVACVRLLRFSCRLAHTRYPARNPLF